MARKTTKRKSEPREVRTEPQKTLMTEMQDDAAADFFEDLGNDSPYVKMAAEGMAGTGKTYTLAQIALGLYKKIGSKKPIVVFDTENSAKFLKPYFAENNIRVQIKKSRSLADLSKTMEFCREGYSDILFIDSLTHIWQKLLDSFLKEKKKRHLSISDWGILKPIWRERFTEPFVDDKYHAFFTGRAGFEYESEINDETGKREFFKSSIKMKAEGETAYEPDILILMERFEELLNPKKPKVIFRQATVIKSRYAAIDGKTFKQPSYKDFAPAIDWILSDAVAPSAPKRSYSNAELIESDDDKREYIRTKRIAIEKIEAFGHKHFGSAQSKDDKRKKIMLLESAFGTASWTEIQEFSVKDLEVGLEKMKQIMDADKKESEPKAPSNGKDEFGYSAFEKHREAIESAGDALALKRAAEGMNADYEAGNLTKEQYAKLDGLLLNATMK
jgi:hypothetical protein